MKVIFWDFDGTLVHSNPLWSGSVYNALKQVCPDTEVEFSEIRKYMAHGFTWHTPNEDYSLITGDKWWAHMNAYFFSSYIALGVPADIAESATKQIRTIIKRKENYTLYPDSVSTLKTLNDMGFTNALLSNNYPDLIEVLEKLGIADFFDNIIISAKVGYDKPRQEIFEIAKNLYSNAEVYYMIGDSVNADIIGGNNAGMTTVLVHRGNDENADHCVDELEQIIEIMSE